MVTDTSERIPERIGPYEITTPIGRGGMGLILQALRTDLGKPCVVKIMHPELAGNPSYCRMFRNEAFVGAQLRHNRIVGVQDFGEHEGRLYLVMDRVDGVNLEQLTKALVQHEAGPLELGLVLYIIEELLEALAYAHDRLLGREHDHHAIRLPPHDAKRGQVLAEDRQPHETPRDPSPRVEPRHEPRQLLPVARRRFTGRGLIRRQAQHAAEQRGDVLGLHVAPLHVRRVVVTT